MLSLSYTDFTVMPPASSRWAQRPLGRSIWRFVRLAGGEILSAICFLAHSGNWPTLNLQNTTNCQTTCQDLTDVLMKFQSPGIWRVIRWVLESWRIAASSSSFQLGLQHILQTHHSQEAYCASLFRRSHFRHQSILLVRATRETP